MTDKMQPSDPKSLPLSDVPATIRNLVHAATEEGNGIVSVVRWTRALVVHMRDPLEPVLRDTFAAACPQLRYFRWAGSPHYRPDEGFYDDAADPRACISFPVEARPPEPWAATLRA